MKNLSFTKDDIILALISSMNDSLTKATLVKNLLLNKIDRLDKESKYEKKLFSIKFGSDDTIEKNWNKLSNKERKSINNKINKLNSLFKQKKEYIDFYNELNKTSFSNANMSNFKSKLKQVFKWDEPADISKLFE